MKAAARLALDAASVRGVTYADARVVSIRNRSLRTKRGRGGDGWESESRGVGVRVIAGGAWGFAASADLDRAAVEAAAARAIEIAKASARVKREDVRLAPEPAAVAAWTTPFKVDPFTTSVEQNLDPLLRVDAEMRAVAGVTLAETGMNFQREESWFLSSEGSDIHQTKYSTGAGYTAYAFAGSEIQKRSYPTSFGGQWQNHGCEQTEDIRLVENAQRVAEEAVAWHQPDQFPEGTSPIILDRSPLGF